jgi:hypothetical protein
MPIQIETFWYLIAAGVAVDVLIATLAYGAMRLIPGYLRRVAGLARRQ